MDLNFQMICWTFWMTWSISGFCNPNRKTIDSNVKYLHHSIEKMIDLKTETVEFLRFNRKDIFQLGLGPAFQFGIQIQRLLINWHTTLVAYTPEFYTVNRTIYPTYSTDIDSFTDSYTQFTLPVLQTGISIQFQIQ